MVDSRKWCKGNWMALCQKNMNRFNYWLLKQISICKTSWKYVCCLEHSKSKLASEIPQSFFFFFFTAFTKLCCFLGNVERSQIQYKGHITMLQIKGSIDVQCKYCGRMFHWYKTVMFSNNIPASCILQSCTNSKGSNITTDFTWWCHSILLDIFNPLDWSFDLCSAEKLCVSYSWILYTVKAGSTPKDDIMRVSLRSLWTEMMAVGLLSNILTVQNAVIR